MSAGEAPASVDVRYLCALVAELERKVRRSHSGQVLIQSYEVAVLARVVEALDADALAAARALRR